MKLLFVLRQFPTKDSFASEVVFFRHIMSLLRKGEQLSVHCPRRVGSTSSLPYKSVGPQRRQWWWPPMRFGTEGVVWKQIWRQQTRLTARSFSPDVIVSHLIPSLLDYAILAAEKVGAPLLLFVHDKFEESVGQALERAAKKGVRISTVSVTRDLADLVSGFGVQDSRVLLPVPETWDEFPAMLPRDSPDRSIAISGTIYHIPQTLRVLAQTAKHFGFAVKVVASPQSSVELKNIPNVQPIPFFDTAKECADFMVRSCRAIIVPYPIAEPSDAKANFLRASFPSRLVQFSQTGLPMAVVAPPDFAVSRWCANHCPELLATSAKEFGNFLQKLDDPTATISQQTSTENLRQFFSAKAIHEDFHKIVSTVVAGNNR